MIPATSLRVGLVQFRKPRLLCDQLGRLSQLHQKASVQECDLIVRRNVGQSVHHRQDCASPELRVDDVLHDSLGFSIQAIKS